MVQGKTIGYPVPPWRGSPYVPPADVAPATFTILVYYPHFFGEGFERDIDLEPDMGVPVRCRFTRDREALEDADAVLMHLPAAGGPLPEKRAGQKWIAMSMESALNCPALADAGDPDRYDIEMSYRRGADVPALYFEAAAYRNFRREGLRVPRIADPAPVLYLASNPVPERDDFVRDLSRHIGVDSYGRCLNNRDWRDVERGLDAREPEQSLIAAYRFYLAIENSRCDDYVTEKLLRALAVGTVPVYRGAPNIRELLPDPDAVVSTDDFDTPADLAAYLRRLLADPSAMARHLAWRNKPWPASFAALVSVGSVPARERLAIKLAHGCGRECCCGGRLV
ncbi:MAG TPA: glycosyltransferase family 10 [Arenicellales bacterium]|nr:glycosyltransferase family 10 [Arenicellales bacterium]